MSPGPALEKFNDPRTPPACGQYPASGCSTSSLLYEKACMERTAYYLSLSPMCQARAIAKHYCAYAMIARDLLQILECAAQGSNQNADAAVEHIVKAIKDGHAHDFGIPLAWSNAPADHSAAPADMLRLDVGTDTTKEDRS